MRLRSFLMFCAGIVVAVLLIGNRSELNDSSAGLVDRGNSERFTSNASSELGTALRAPGEDLLDTEAFVPEGIQSDNEPASARTDSPPPTRFLAGDEGERNGTTRFPLDARVRLRDEMVALHEKLENETESAWGQAKGAELFNYLMTKRDLIEQFGAYDGFSVECRETVCAIQVKGFGADPFGTWNRAMADIRADFPEFEFMQGGTFLNPAGTEVALVAIGERKGEASTRSVERASARS